jgi:hypothetical protein
MDEVTIVPIELAVAQFVIPIPEDIEYRALEGRENLEEFVRACAADISCNHDCIERIRYRCSQFLHSRQVVVDV